jgi:hypothetical protein
MVSWSLEGTLRGQVLWWAVSEQLCRKASGCDMLLGWIQISSRESHFYWNKKVALFSLNIIFLTNISGCKDVLFRDTQKGNLVQWQDSMRKENKREFSPGFFFFISFIYLFYTKQECGTQRREPNRKAQTLLQQDCDRTKGANQAHTKCWGNNDRAPSLQICRSRNEVIRRKSIESGG